jgi:hypothetical protein
LLFSSSIHAGQHVVSGIDAYEDLNLTRPSSFRATMLKRGTHETILTQHGEGQQTHLHGSAPIDGIFVSAGLSGLRCGHTGWFSDHVLSYIDIPSTTALGTNLPPLYSAQARRLKLGDKRTVHKYQAQLSKFFQEHSIAPRLQQLWDRANADYWPADNKPTPSVIATAQYDLLDSLITHGILQAERRCRQLHMGAIPWSPEYKAIEDELRLYHPPSHIQRSKNKTIHSPTYGSQVWSPANPPLDKV